MNADDFFKKINDPNELLEIPREVKTEEAVKKIEQGDPESYTWYKLIGTLYGPTHAQYILYKVINTLNGMEYVGQHTTYNIDDNYMGSGSFLIWAINKYGKEHFRKEILLKCDNQYELNEQEALYVNEEYISSPNTYNIVRGGRISLSEYKQNLFKPIEGDFKEFLIDNKLLNQHYAEWKDDSILAQTHMYDEIIPKDNKNIEVDFFSQFK